MDGPLTPPLWMLRNLHEEAVRGTVNAALDARVRLLGNIVAFMEAQTRDAFAGSGVGEVRGRALQLGRNSRALWVHLMQVGDDLAATHLASQDIAKRTVDVWWMMARQVEHVFPCLPPAARIFVRSSGYLVSTKLQDAVAHVPDLAAIVEHFAQAEEDFPLLIVGLMQALSLFGTEGGLAPTLMKALAEELWNCLSEGLDEDEIEDAYWSARADEAKLEGGDSVLIDDVTRRPH